VLYLLANARRFGILERGNEAEKLQMAAAWDSQNALEKRKKVRWGLQLFCPAFQNVRRGRANVLQCAMAKGPGRQPGPRTGEGKTKLKNVYFQ
jgi:hypothetical protein